MKKHSVFEITEKENCEYEQWLNEHPIRNGMLTFFIEFSILSTVALIISGLLYVTRIFTDFWTVWMITLCLLGIKLYYTKCKHAKDEE